MSYTWNKAKEDFYRGGMIFLSFAFFATITYAAISWPATPSGETAGGKYSAKLVPSGAIMAFNLASCPTGWKAADGTNSTPDLRGEFLRWLDNGRGVDTGRLLNSWQDGTEITDQVNQTVNLTYFNADKVRDYTTWNSAPGSNGTNRGISLIKMRPRNVAFLYCIKD